MECDVRHGCVIPRDGAPRKAKRASGGAGGSIEMRGVAGLRGVDAVALAGLAEGQYVRGIPCAPPATVVAVQHAECLSAPSAKLPALGARGVERAPPAQQISPGCIARVGTRDILAHKRTSDQYALALFHVAFHGGGLPAGIYRNHAARNSTMSRPLMAETSGGTAQAEPRTEHAIEALPRRRGGRGRMFGFVLENCL